MNWGVEAAALALVGAALWGCTEAVATPTAYEGQRPLCTAGYATAFQAELDQCQKDYERDQSCAGIASFTGQLQNRPTTVESRLTQTQFSDHLISAGGETVRGEMQFEGRSPYYFFSLSMRNVGGPIDGTKNDYQLRIGGGEGTLETEDALNNDVVEGKIDVYAAGQSIRFVGDSGQLIISRQQATEEAGRFQMTLHNSTDSLEGCFYAFATSTNRNFN
jgi:hypothetical protein